MTKNQFLSSFFIALLAFVAYQIILILSPFVHSIFWAAILTFAFYPLYEKLRRALKTQDTAAALLMTFLMMLFVIPPVVAIATTLFHQALELYDSAATFIREKHHEQLIDQLRAYPFIQRIETRLFDSVVLKENVTLWTSNLLKTLGNLTVDQVREITKNTFFVGLNTVLMFMLVFAFFKDGKKVYEFIYDITPLEENNKKPVFAQINETFAAVIRGQLVTALTQGFLAGCIFWGLGLPLPVLFAAITCIASIIPVVGASAVWLPFVFYLVMTTQYLKAFILLLLGVLVISVADNVLKPMLIGEKTKVPYFLLFFGILGGIKLYGLLGVFVAPVVLSLFFSLIKIYQNFLLSPERDAS